MHIVDPLPTAPSRASPANFPTLADAWVAAMAVFGLQVNQVASDINDAANAAAASAATAVNAPGTSATSTTSTTIANAVTKTFAIQTGKLFAIGQTVTVASAANPSNRMIGIVTAANGTTGSLSVLVKVTGGTGTFADWSIALTAPLDLLIATIAELMAGTANDRVVTPATLIGAQAWQTLVDASTITADLTAGCNLKVTMAGNRTIATPTGLKEGQVILLLLINDATGSRVPSFATSFDFGLAGTPVMPTAANSSMLLVGIVGPGATSIFTSRSR